MKRFEPLVGAEDGALSPLASAVFLAADAVALRASFRASYRRCTPFGARHDDDLWRGDVVELFVAPDPDDRSRYFEIEVGPTGLVFDARVHSPELDRRSMVVDRSWNPAGLVVKSRLVAAFWLVSIRLPWSELGLGAAPSQVAVNAYRIDQASLSQPLYLALEPTMRRPADFHVPRAFRTIAVAAKP